MTFPNRMSRRSSFKVMGALGLGVSVPSLLWRPSALQAKTSLQTVSKTLPLMETLVSMTACDPSRMRAEEALEKAFRRVQDLIPVFDRFDADSRLGRLNQTGSLRDVPPQLFEVLETSKYLYHRSTKTFDVTILPLLEEHRDSVIRTGRPPEIRRVQAILASVGFAKIQLDPRTIRFRHSGVRITLDGIAKGYLVDQAAQTLRRAGVHSALIDAGGDIRAVGSKGPGPWRIGLEDPLGRKKRLMAFRLADLAVATSGNYEQYFDPLARHHHIVSKDLGDSPRRIISATATAPTAMLADGLSTMLFLQTPEQGLACIESMPECEALLITRGGRMFPSSGWHRLLA